MQKLYSVQSFQLLVQEVDIPVHFESTQAVNPSTLHLIRDIRAFHKTRTYLRLSVGFKMSMDTKMVRQV